MTLRRRSLAAGLTALALTATLAPVRAVNTTYQDVDKGIWYAAPVAFCQQHELMDGLSSAAFAPDGLLTRAVLYSMSALSCMARPTYSVRCITITTKPRHTPSIHRNR